MLAAFQGLLRNLKMRSLKSMAAITEAMLKLFK